MISKPEPFAIGKHITLRDRMESDVDRFVYWKTHGEWLKYDAPWEGFGDTLTAEQEKNIRTFFLKTVHDGPPVLRYGGMIVHQDGNRLIGNVNRYGDKRFSEVFYLGISICEDDYLNKGLGTEALKLWINYLFGNSGIHKIECHTWSLNPRMMRVTEKLNFQLEGREREMVEWQGERQDRLRYGLLRREWEKW